MSHIFSIAFIFVPFVALLAIFIFRLDASLFAPRSSRKRTDRPRRPFSTPDDGGNSRLFDPDGRKVPSGPASKSE